MRAGRMFFEFLSKRRKVFRGVDALSAVSGMPRESSLQRLQRFAEIGPSGGDHELGELLVWRSLRRAAAAARRARPALAPRAAKPPGGTAPVVVESLGDFSERLAYLNSEARIMESRRERQLLCDFLMIRATLRASRAAKTDEEKMQSYSPLFDE